MSKRPWTMPRTEVHKDCGHITYFSYSPPVKGARIWCDKCRDMRIVTESVVEWNIRCQQCVYRRRYGSDKANAILGAFRHHQKKNHRVDVCNGKTVEHVFDESSLKLPLDKKPKA